MKPNENIKNPLRTILLPLFAFMLVLSTVLPSVASAATPIVVTLEPVTITQNNINTQDSEIKLTLETGQSWVADIATKATLLTAGMTANVEEATWNTYKQDIHIARDPNDQQVLIVTLPSAASYNITKDQTITMNLSAALIEEWPGAVTPVTFNIYAKPQLSLGGSIMNGTTVSDLKTGGKEIELNLVNAKWDPTQISTLTGLSSLLGGFGGWDVAEAIKTVDPNKVVSLTNDDRTLTLKLPPVPTASQLGPITFNTTNVASLAIIDPVPGIGSPITATAPPLTFNIGSSGASSLTVAPTSVMEAGIKAGGATITLTLAGNEWAIGSADNAKKEALIEALVAKTQPEQWLKVKNVLSASSVNISTVTTQNDTATITIPAVAGYKLSANQTITLNVPYQLLKDNNTLNEVEFEIEATPKALVSGSVTPEVSQADIIKGGKTIVVTLVNEKWNANIATNTALREQLLDGFTFDATSKAIIKAGANVVRTNDRVVTITLPPIDGFKLTGVSEIIKFNPITGGLPVSAPYLTEFDAFTINSVVNQTATITSTKTNEFDIVEGGKTITITLKNDIWAKDAHTRVDALTNTNLLMSRFNLKDATGNPSLKKDGTQQEFPSFATVTRTSDTVMTITLWADSNFSLKDDAVADLVIPSELLSVSSNPITTSSFKIDAVKAELPNKDDLVLDKSEVQKGGKTVTMTLKNATFKDISSINIAEILTGNGSARNMIVNELNNDPKGIKITKDKLTIKLPPVPSYNSNVEETISLEIPEALINHNKASKIEVDGKITIGAVATATLSPKTFTNNQIKAGNATFKITLTGTEWDPTIETNKSKKSALLKGFTVSDQTKEWALLNKEISANAQFKLDNNKKELTITFPAVPSYSIIRNQVVDIKIPKSVLVNYKDDVQVTDKLTITVPGGTITDKSIGDLTVEELAKAIEDDKRVIVPAKVVETIFVNTVELPSSEKEKPSITTIEVTTTAAVEEIQVTVAGDTQTVNPKVNKPVFVYANLEKNSELKVSVFGNDKSKPLQSDIYKKIGKGSKTYNEIPKKDLTGSYSIYSLLTDKSLLKEILKHYSIDELKVIE